MIFPQSPGKIRSTGAYYQTQLRKVKNAQSVIELIRSPRPSYHRQTGIPGGECLSGETRSAMTSRHTPDTSALSGKPGNRPTYVPVARTITTA